MTTPINDGGPAFACVGTGHEGQPSHLQEGMSLRDWFAGMIISGRAGNHKLLHRRNLKKSQSDVDKINAAVWENQAKCAYAMADAMLAQREKRP